MILILILKNKLVPIGVCLWWKAKEILCFIATGLKASKSKISPHKLKTDEHRSAGHVEPLSKGPSSDIKAGGSVHQDGKPETSTMTTTASATTTTAIKSILKKSGEEITKQSNHRDSPRPKQGKNTSMADSVRTEQSSTESFDDMEQPVASLTDEEKQIIGLMTHPPSISSDSGSGRSPETKNSLVANSTCSSPSSSNNCISALTNKENKDVVACSEKAMNVNLHVTDTSNDVQIKVEISKDTTNKGLVKKEEMEVEMHVDSSCTLMAEKHDVAISGENANANTEEKTDKIPKRRKSVPLKTSTTTTTTTTTKPSAVQCQDKTPLSDVVSKKKKSLHLTCVTDGSVSAGPSKDSKKVKESAILKGSEVCNKQQPSTALDEFLKSASKSFQEIECSTKMSLIGKDTPVLEVPYVIPKKKKPVDGSAKTLKRKISMKDDSVETSPAAKKKVISEAEINFFGSKKAQKGSKAERPKKSKEMLSPVKTARAAKVETGSLDKRKDLKRKFSKGVTILISDDSDALSTGNADSSSEEESHLKQIWDEYDPEPDFELVEESPVKSQTQTITEVQRKKTYAAVAAATASEEKPSMVDTLGFGKKQRVAHTANHLPRRLSSNANPIRRYPKTISAMQKKDQPASSSSTSVESAAEASVNTVSFKPAKKRVAHVSKNTTPAGSLPRPRIPIEYGAKVPQNQRQRYLDRIVDECLRIYPTEKEAFEKALKEEQALYERSTRRQVYLNLCVNAIKKLREMKPQELPVTSPVETETITRVAVTKTLPSGAVVISTKSPAKQDQPVTTASNDLTEELMYDFLSKYLMSEEDLVENGYPRPCQSTPGKAVFKANKESPSKDSSRRICCRCGKPYVVLEDGEYLRKEDCIYHAGKLYRRRGEQSYSCCQGDAGSPGCCVGKVRLDVQCVTRCPVSRLVYSPGSSTNVITWKISTRDRGITILGSQLTGLARWSCNRKVDFSSPPIPPKNVVGFDTSRIGSISVVSLRDVINPPKELRRILLLIFNDLQFFFSQLIHSKVVDTSIVFPHRLGPPYKRALRNLMADYLKKIIQDSVEGHDSHEDARACLELMRWKVKEDMKRTARHKSPRLSLG
ncbi:unnamed protein product [Porites evermanni]|uniref:RNA exonuclease 1 homolog-like domain-containing protein n=2 Tax=Porites evermanni TaxID=104178 RepID=A0ABN8R340_9CNID|nr:unnamed protein product [Porites evermanni]